MTAPTTRETADHAELVRLAEAATRGDWRAHITTKRSPEIYTNVPPPNTPNPKIAGAILRKADARFIAAANPARVLSLLSEVAALRGALEEAEKDASSWSRCAGEVVTIGEGWKERFVRAERQRDELRKALEPFAALADKFGCWSVVEVCAPEPGNTSPVIQPVPLSAFETAAALIANQGADHD